MILLIPCGNWSSSANETKTSKEKTFNLLVFFLLVGKKKRNLECPGFSLCPQKAFYNNKRWQLVLLLLSRFKGDERVPCFSAFSLSLSIFTCQNVRVSCTTTTTFGLKYGSMPLEWKVSAGGCGKRRKPKKIPAVTAESHEDTKWEEMKTNTRLSGMLTVVVLPHCQSWSDE